MIKINYTMPISKILTNSYSNTFADVAYNVLVVKEFW